MHSINSMNTKEKDKLRRSRAKTIPMSKRLLKVIGKTNAEFKLIAEGDKILVGLSGGKDSTAMLLMMLEKGMSIHSVVFFLVSCLNICLK